MKALRLTGILILSLFLFSCATTKTQENIPEEIEEVTVPEVLQDSNLETPLSEENLNEDPADFMEEENSEDFSVANDILHQELEEIPEPEIIDLEPPVEDSVEEKEIVLESEIIPDSEIELEELPEMTVHVENTEDEETVSLTELNTNTENSVQTENVEIKENENQENSAVNEVEVNSSEAENETEKEEVSVIQEDSDEVEVLDAGAETSEEQNLKAEQVIIPSRSVNMKLLEYVDVIYPGKGWIFMGLTDNSKDLSYNGRQIGTENTIFSLQAKNPGTKILHFYKNDALKGDFIDDYVEVIISKEKGSPKTHISAPDYKSPLPVKTNQTQENNQEEELNNLEENSEITTEEAVNQIEKTATSENKTEINKSETEKSTMALKSEQSTSATENQNTENSVNKNQTENTEAKIDTDGLFTDAKKAFDAKDYSTAINKFVQFLEHSTTKRDEALYLLGQMYETPGTNQDVQQAINSYTTLITNYPSSKFWDNANKRIIYLKRFYMEGR